MVTQKEIVEAIYTELDEFQSDEHVTSTSSELTPPYSARAVPSLR